MGRGLPDELLEQIFGCLDTRTIVLVVSRVCRLWKHVCRGMKVRKLDLAWLADTELFRLAHQYKMAPDFGWVTAVAAPEVGTLGHAAHKPGPDAMLRRRS